MSKIDTTVTVLASNINAIEDRMMVAQRMIEMAQRAIDRIDIAHPDRALASTLLDSAEQEIAKAVEEIAQQRATETHSAVSVTAEDVACALLDKFEDRFVLCLADRIPLDMVAAALDIKKVAAEVDTGEIAQHLEISASDVADALDISASDIASELDIDAEEIAKSIDLSDVADYIDAEDVAQWIDASEVAKYITPEIDIEKVAPKAIAEEIDYADLAAHCAEGLSITADDVVRTMLANGIKGEIVGEVTSDISFVSDVSAKVAATMAKVDATAIAREVALHGSESIAMAMLADRETAGRLGDSVTTAMARRMMG